MSRLHHKGGEPEPAHVARGRTDPPRRGANCCRAAKSTIPILKGRSSPFPVNMSPDLKLATVYVMPLGGKDAGAIVATLDRHKKFLRGEIAHRVNLKFAPEIRFGADDSFDNAERIDALLHSPKVAQDLARDPTRRE